MGRKGERINASAKNKSKDMILARQGLIREYLREFDIGGAVQNISSHLVTAAPSYDKSENTFRTPYVRVRFNFDSAVMDSRPIASDDFDPSVRTSGDGREVEMDLMLLPTVYSPEPHADFAYFRSLLTFTEVYRKHHEFLGRKKTWHGGDRILVIGAGSGVDLAAMYTSWLHQKGLTVQQAWNNPELQPSLTVREINPVAVAELNDFVRRLGLHPSKVKFENASGPYSGKYDLIIWNMPAVTDEENIAGTDLKRLDDYHDGGKNAWRALDKLLGSLSTLLADSDAMFIAWNSPEGKRTVKGPPISVEQFIRDGGSKGKNRFEVTTYSRVVDGGMKFDDTFYVTKPVSRDDGVRKELILVGALLAAAFLPLLTPQHGVMLSMAAMALAMTYVHQNKDESWKSISIPGEDFDRFVPKEIQLLFKIAAQQSLHIMVVGGSARDAAVAIQARKPMKLPTTDDMDVVILGHDASDEHDPVPSDFAAAYRKELAAYFRTEEGGSLSEQDATAKAALMTVDFLFGVKLETGEYVYRQFMSDLESGTAFGISLLGIEKKEDGSYVILGAEPSINNLITRTVEILGDRRLPGFDMTLKMLGKWAIYNEMKFSVFNPLSQKTREKFIENIRKYVARAVSLEILFEGMLRHASTGNVKEAKARLVRLFEDMSWFGFEPVESLRALARPETGDSAIKVRVMGGANDSGPGASGYLLSIGGKNILLDAGGDSYERLKASGERVDAVLISHAHQDHIGDVVRVFNEHKAPVFSLSGTRVWSQMMLSNSLGFADPAERPALKDGLKSISRHWNGVEGSQWYSLTDDIKILFKPTSHIAGAALIYIATPYGNILYTDQGNGHTTHQADRASTSDQRSVTLTSSNLPHSATNNQTSWRKSNLFQR
jgi:hypothetical protein